MRLVMNRMRTPRALSLRRRLWRWIASALTVAIAVLTLATVVEERRLALAIGAATGESLVAHLAEMPGFRADLATARAHVEHLDATLRGAGMRLELASPLAPSSGVVARRPLPLGDGMVELRYRADAPWLTELLRRALVHHLVLGGAALALLVIGTGRIIRSRLEAPLQAFAHQVRFMSSGGGWNPVLPRAEAELADLACALEDLGPALHRQVQVWVEGERRAGAARALSDVRARLREPRRRALALLGDLQARGLVGAAAKPGIRALLVEIERIAREIDAEEREWFGRDARPAAANRDRAVAGGKGSHEPAMAR